MKPRSRRSRNSDNSYWKSITDAMSGLMMILLLILMLFMVRILSLEKDGTSNYQYDNISENSVEDNDDDDHKKDHEYDQTDSGGGAGEYTEVPKAFENEFEYAAIQVVVKDEDTDKVIPQEGIGFKVYDANHKTMLLHTYYPHKESYDSFETEENGSFLLPERIYKGTYTVHNLNAPKGYGLASDTSFTVNDYYFWDHPYVVNVYVGPSKNQIYVQEINKDHEKMKALGTYTIYANEDIEAGGIQRFKKDEVVDTIHCDENGLGVSKQLYLGEYRIVQEMSQKGYVMQEEKVVKLTQDMTSDSIQEMLCEKTSISIHLQDENESNVPIAGATFVFTNNKNDASSELVTDENGQIHIEDLDKGVTYTLKQTTTLPNYKMSQDTYSFEVDEKGRINGQSEVVLQATNYTIRVDIDIVDSLLRTHISNQKVDVYDENNHLVGSYTSTSRSIRLEGLEEGQYKIVLNNQKEKTIEIKDEGNIQSYSMSLFTITDIVVVAIGVLFIIGIMAIIVVLRRGKK